MLQSDQIILRAPELSDLDFLYTLENNIDNWEVSETLLPFSKQLLKTFILQQNDIHTTKQYRWIIEYQQQKPVGCVDIYHYDPLHRRAGIGIIVLPEYRKNGFAAQALKLIETYARKILKLHQLYCFIHAKNRQSIKLFESEQYRHTGTQKDWYFNGKHFDDVFLFQKIL